MFYFKPMLKKLSKNLIYLTISTITGKLFFFCMVIVISRALGVAELGKYFFSLSFVMLFSALLDIGLFTLAVRDVSQEKKIAQKYLANILSIKVILGLLVFFIIFIVLKFMPWLKDSIVNIYLLYFFVMLDSLNLAPKVIFRAYEKMQFEMFSEVIGKTIGVITAVFFAFLINARLPTVLAAMILGNFVGLLFSYIFLKKELIKMSFAWEIKFWKYLFKAAFPFLIAWLFLNIFTSLDKIFLKAFCSNEALGRYSAAYVIANVVQLMPFIIASVLFPSMARYYKENKLELKKTCNIALKIGLFLSFLISSIIFFCSNFAVNTLFHFDVLSVQLTTNYLQVIIWAQVPIFAYSMLTILFLSTENQKMLITVNGVGFLASLIINLILIYYFGVMGACFGVVILHTAILLTTLILVQKNIFDIDAKKTILKFCLAASGFALIYFCTIQQAKAVASFVSIFAFLFILFLGRFFEQSEIRLIKNKFFPKQKIE